jgi:dolichyl-phosphate-mannose--protein O-mannosyl transferase
MATTEALPETRDEEDAPPLARPLWRPIPGSRLYGWLGPLAVAAFGFVLRLYNIAIPGRAAFDEVYYNCDAQMLLRYGYEHAHMNDNVCVVDVTTPGPAFVVHPPLGKWLIAIGEALFGWSSNGGTQAVIGWRFSACLFGSLAILVLARMGRRMFRSTLLGCLAGLLLALDGLHFTMSRLAMLDIFLMFFVVAAAACLVADRDWGRRKLQERLGTSTSRFGPGLGFRPWRLAAGVMIGCAVGTKWSGAYYVGWFLHGWPIIGLLPLVALAWDTGARRAAGIPRPFTAALVRDGLPIVAALAVLPIVTYVATWAGWFVTDGGWRRTCGDQWTEDCGAIRGFVKYHREIYDFHVGLDDPHPYQSRPYGWLLLARPVLYVYNQPSRGMVQVALGIGTPMIWWGSVVALLGCVWGWISRRDWRAAFIVAAFAYSYLPWFWPSDRTQFLFYALPALPFMCLAIAYCCGRAIGGPDASPDRRMIGSLLVAAYVGLVVLNFFYLYPILSSQVVTTETWRARMWFSSWV